MAIENLEGKADEVIGSVQSTAGKVISDGGLQADGAARKLGGDAREIYGDTKDAFETAMSDAFGNGFNGRSAQRAIGGAADTVRTSSVLSLLAAAAFGYVVALALHR